MHPVGSIKRKYSTINLATFREATEIFLVQLLAQVCVPCDVRWAWLELIRQSSHKLCSQSKLKFLNLTVTSWDVALSSAGSPKISMGGLCVRKDPDHMIEVSITM